MQTRPTTIEGRLDQLECQNRWLKRLVITSMLCGASLIFMGQRVVKTLTAEQFLLTDSQGKRRAELSTSDKGTPRLFLFDKKRTVRLSLAVQHDGQPMVILYDKARKPRIMVSTRSDSSQALVLFDKNQKARTTLATRKDGSPLLFFANAKGQVTSLLPRPSRH